MKKAITIIFFLIISMFLFGCSDSASQIQENENKEFVSDETGSISSTGIAEDLTDFENAPFKAICLTRIKIRNDHSLDGAVIGYLDEGDVFEVLETYNDGEYIWNRIFDDCWFANDGEWIKRIPYSDNVDNVIPDIVKFKVPKETHEKLHSESFNLVTDVDNLRIFYNSDDYMCTGSSYNQKTNYKYLDGSFEDSSYEESRSSDLASAYNPFINIQSGKNCSYEYDENGRITNITVDLTPGNDNNLTYWEFEYNTNGQIQRACLYSHDRSILMHELIFQNDSNGRIISIDENTWNDNTAVKVDRFYYTTTYEYNGNIIHIVQTRKGEPVVRFSKIIKLDNGAVKTVYYFVGRESDDWTLSITDFKYK